MGSDVAVMFEAKFELVAAVATVAMVVEVAAWRHGGVAAVAVAALTDYA